MRKFTLKSATLQRMRGVNRPDDGGQAWFRRKWRLLSIMAIILLAFLIRFVFAYGISAGDNFALSGGASALNNLDAIVSILNGTFSFTNPSLNYPIGSLNASPPLFSAIMAGLAGLATLFGVSAETAAAGALAWTAPVFAALTCYPVYLVAKRMFGDDEKIGLLAALFYAFFALLVMNTVFSNGTEYAFVGLLFAWMVHFLLKAMGTVDGMHNADVKSLFGDRVLLKDVLVAGLLFAMIALSWSQFRVVLTCLVVLMVLQALVDRFRSRDVSLTTGIYSVVILMGLLISAPYYIAAGLWAPIYSGPFVMGLLSVALMAVFVATSNRSWVLMVPIIAVIAAAVIALMHFAVNDVFSALVFGNNLYEGDLMTALMAGSNTTISRMAAYYGWFTLWLPVMVFLWMLYKYPENLDSRKYAFTMFFIISMFGIGWYATSYAIIAGIGFAAASAAALMFAVRWTDLKGYFKEMRSGDLGVRLKKIAKPMPLALTILVVALVAVPNAVYAVDAATPSNSEDADGYFGGLGYTIQTHEYNSMNMLWSHCDGEDKSGALVTWLGYSSDAVAMGGFDSVTDGVGGGASAMTSTLLAEGGSGAVASMAVRLMLAGEIADFKVAIVSAGLDYQLIAGYIKDPRTAVAAVNSDIGKYPGHGSDLTDENALYAVLTEYLVSTLSGPDLFGFYDDICAKSGDRIAYVAVNGGMLPLYYGDGSYFSTIAYFGDSLTDRYGANTQYFSYNQYTGYTAYTDAMYETFLWKSVIGPSASHYGFTSSIPYLNALALSDGTVKAVPGYGLGGYTVAYWTVMYNPSDDATLSSDGWMDMDGYEAIALQNEQGGMINYLAGVTLMEYVGSDADSTVFQGSVSYTVSGGTAPAAGVEVAVYTRVNYDSSGVVTYIPTSVEKTAADGSYSILVPDGADYYVTVSTGAVASTNGSVIETFGDVSAIPAVYLIERTGVDGSITVGGEQLYDDDLNLEMEGRTSGHVAEASTSDGTFSFDFLVPDVYTLSAYKSDGTLVLTETVSVTAGTTGGLRVNAASGKIVVTVSDEYGASADSGTVIATDTSTGLQFRAGIVDGSATIQVVPGTYVISAADGKVMASASSNITVSSGGSKTSSVTVFDSKKITVSGAPAGSEVTLMSLGYTAVSRTGTFEVPLTGAGQSVTYTAYAVVDGKVYSGQTAGSSITMSASTAYTVSGTVKDASGSKAGGVTVTYISADGKQFVFSADGSGVYTAVLQSGTYTVYAYDTDGNAYLGRHTVSADGTNDIDMTGSRTISTTLRYYTQITSSGTKGIAFADVQFTVVIGGETYVLAKSTGTDGKVQVRVPAGYAVTAVLEKIDTAGFYCAKQTKEFSSGKSSDSVTWSLRADPADDADMHVKTVTVSSDYVAELVKYTDSEVKYTVSGSKSIPVGRYLVTVSGSTGYHFDGSVNVYPGAAGKLAIDAVPVVAVTLASDSNDRISVYAEESDGGSGSYFIDADDSNIYYLEKGYSFHFTAKSTVSGVDRIAYGSVIGASSPTAVDLTGKAEAVTVTGFAGVVADGTVTVTYGAVAMPFKVSSGVFELTLPKGQAMALSVSVSQTDKAFNNTTYVYESSRTLVSAAVVDGAVVNMASTTASQESDTVLEGSGANFSGGVGSFVLKVTNKGSFANTYVVTGGSAWVLQRTYTLNVAGGSSGTLVVEGFYDAANVGAGNPGLSVDVTDISGNTVGSYVLDGTGFHGTATPTAIGVAGDPGASNDAMSTYEYLYALTFTNGDAQMKKAKVTAAAAGSGWTVVVSDGDQHTILVSGGSFDIKGLTDTVIYVKVMSADGSSTDIPDVSVSIDIDGTTETMTLRPDSVSVDTSDMSAGGPNVFNSEKPIPAFFWVLMSLCVLGLIFIAWSGSKRGVFSRRK